MQHSLNLTKLPLAIFKSLQPNRIVIRLTLASLDVYVIGQILYFVLRPLTGDGFWYVFLGTNLVQFGFFPSLIVLPFLMLARQWPRAGMFAVHLLLVAHAFGGLFVPGRTNAAPDGAVVLKVVTYNVANNYVSPDALADMLLDSDADIIGLQEFSREQAATLRTDLLDAYPYQVLNPGWVRGKALLSRYPITDYDIFRIGDSRPYIDATLDINGEALRVFVAHPPAPGMGDDRNGMGYLPAHAEEIRGLIARADGDAPTLMMGDFNVTDQADNYRLLTNAGYTDVFRAVGWGLGATFPADYMPIALWRIDYVWASPHLMPLNSQVGEGVGSDHFPLVAELALLTASSTQ